VRRSFWRRVVRRAWRTAVAIFAVIGLITTARPFLFDLTPIISGSMAPTLQGDVHGGDWVLAEKLSYYFRAPRRWEVVEFTNSEGIQVMKRVAALPGESITVKNNRAVINGAEVIPPVDPPPRYYPYGNLLSGKPVDAGSGYYVLGDDSVDSQDSRYEGTVRRESIRARAWLIVWPLNRFGWVR
jgi:signal peptidase I